MLRGIHSTTYYNLSMLRGIHSTTSYNLSMLRGIDSTTYYNLSILRGIDSTTDSLTYLSCSMLYCFAQVYMYTCFKIIMFFMLEFSKENVAGGDSSNTLFIPPTFWRHVLDLQIIIYRLISGCIDNVVNCVSWLCADIKSTFECLCVLILRHSRLKEIFLAL
jgi:hypothetical protein